MLNALRYYWIVAKGYRLHPWASPYIQWRMETVFGKEATGLGAGILLDATVVRMLLVPALVSLFGRWNWVLPSLPARVLRIQPSVPHQEFLAETSLR